jgi:two-component system cell cycle response regulator
MPAAGVRASDMIPLAERMGHLQALRAGFALTVIVAGTTAVVGSHASSTPLVFWSVCYAVLTACAEGLRRVGNERRLRVVAAMLLLDGVYLAAVIGLTGIADSPLRALVYLHLIAVTLLTSYRTGVKLALWHSLLFLVAFFVDRAGTIHPGAGAASAGAESSLALNVAIFWSVALGTAAYSNLNERELRRNRAHLESLASMAAKLEVSREPDAVGSILLDEVMLRAGIVRGLVVCAHGDGLSLLASRGTSANLRTTGIDAVIARAWEEKRILLMKALDRRTDPRLCEALPGARNLLVAPMLAESRPIGALIAAFGGRRGHVGAGTVAVVGQLTAHAALALQNARLLQQLKKLAEVDPLTAVANRRTFASALDRELARAARRSEQLALVMIDIDHFKRYNDEHGHPAGDDLLRRVSRALEEASREYDVVARYGGEEFAVILPACDPTSAEDLGNRLRESICLVEAVTRVTASAGVAVFPLHAGDSADLIKAADDALYASKRAGRNRVTVASTAVRAAVTAVRDR